MESAGDASSWQTVLERYVREENAQEKTKLLYGLGKPIGRERIKLMGTF